MDIGYLVQHIWQVWMVIAILSLILELTSGDFFIICFFFGGVAALISSLFGVSLYIQVLIFGIFSVVALLWLRPLALRYLHSGEDKRVSNADALLNRQGRVVEPIPVGGFGRVQIDGDVWKASSSSTQPIAEGQTVVVVDRKSTIITVEPV